MFDVMNLLFITIFSSRFSHGADNRSPSVNSLCELLYIAVVVSDATIDINVGQLIVVFVLSCLGSDLVTTQSLVQEALPNSDNHKQQ
jgi:hypothetical protein